MLIQEIRGNDPDTALVIPLLLENKSSIYMGESYRDTKHNRHILRRYHYTRWMIKDGHIALNWVPGEIQMVDPNTKNLFSSVPTFILCQAMVETAVKP